jgi:hypothetical protein
MVLFSGKAVQKGSLVIRRQAHDHGHQRGSPSLISEAEGGWGVSRKSVSLSKNGVN